MNNNVQRHLLNRYMELMGNPSFRQISDDTGIQVTRVFRIFNGQELKLNEYLIFKERINQKTEGEKDLSLVDINLENGLPLEKLRVIIRRLKRELTYAEIV